MPYESRSSGAQRLAAALLAALLSANVPSGNALAAGDAAPALRGRAATVPDGARASSDPGGVIEGAGGKSVFGATSPRPELDLPAIAKPSSQPPPRLVVGLPLRPALARGLVVIPYRTDNLRIVAVYGRGGLEVVPRIGHLHITLDDAPWHWVDASGEPITIQFLPPGRHNVLIQLADPTHHVIDSHRVFFEIPAEHKIDNFRRRA